MRWTPEEWWAGEDAYIIGGGPSLEKFDWQRLVGKRTVGCNDAFRLGPAVCSVCIFGDMRWFQVHRRELQNFPNPVFTNQPGLHQGNSIPWIKTLPRERWGLHKNALGWGFNTGCSAVNLALILGAKRIFLLGFDMGIREGRTNWHRANLGKPSPASYVRYQDGFAQVKKDLPRAFPGREVLNAGPDSLLTVFPKVDLEVALCGSPS